MRVPPFNPHLPRYHNREAVVISALQVKKYPLATPGPFGTMTPPPIRHFIPTANTLIALNKKIADASQRNNANNDKNDNINNAVTHMNNTNSSITANNNLNNNSNNTTITGETKIEDALPPMSPAKPTYERTQGTHLLERSSIITAPSPSPRRPSATRSVLDKTILESPRQRHPSRPGQGSLDRTSGSPFIGGRDSPQLKGSLERSYGSPVPHQKGSSLERSFGSPLFSRTSSPHPSTTFSELTRSIMGSPRPDFRHSPRPPHSPKIKLR